MWRNMSGTERWIRVLVGSALVMLVFTGPETPLGWLGLILVVTGLVGYCPLYRLFGRRPLPRGRAAT